VGYTHRFRLNEQTKKIICLSKKSNGRGHRENKRVGVNKRMGRIKEEGEVVA
jgi:hypothetical protein